MVDTIHILQIMLIMEKILLLKITEIGLTKSKPGTLLMNPKYRDDELSDSVLGVYPVNCEELSRLN